MIYNLASNRVLVGGELGNNFSDYYVCETRMFVGEAFNAFLNRNILHIEGI